MARLFRQGGPAQGEVTQVSATGSGLVVHAAAGPITLSYDGIRGRIGGFEDAWILFAHDTHPGVEVWVDPEFVRGPMTERSPGFPEPFASQFAELTAIHRRRGRTRWVVRGTLGAAFLALVVWFLSGGLTTMAVNAIPYPLESSLGDAAAESFAAEQPECTEPAAVEMINTILDRLVEQMDEVNYEYRVRILRSEDVNAFALPGGEIFFLGGLLDEADSEHEVAAVMGHEIQHVVKRHGLRGMVQSAGVRVLFMLVLGDASQGLQVLGSYAGKLGTLKFGRDQEREADELGVALMSEAGFDPQGAVTFFGKLAEITGDEGGTVSRIASMASTHPASTERQERLGVLAKQLAPAEPRGLDVEWAKVSRLCMPGTP